MFENLKIMSHDVFRFGGGLNKTGAVIYLFLLDHPSTVKEICKATDIPKNTVLRKLKIMRKIVDKYTGEMFWLVTKEGRMYYANCDADLDAVAFQLGTAGKGRKQRERFNQERRKHKKYFRQIREQKRGGHDGPEKDKQ